MILKEDVPNIGKKGELTNVINGYWCALFHSNRLSVCNLVRQVLGGTEPVSFMDMDAQDVR